AGEMPERWDADLPRFGADGDPVATRKASGEVIQWAAAALPHLVGGSADLATSNLTDIDGGGDVERGSYGGRNLHFGVREHGMGAITNGLCLHGFRAYGGTFLTFSDYMRGAIRLSALMKLPAIWVYTHDSIGLGEDGPTHQPIEQLAAMRAMPGLRVIRPADANESAQALRLAIEGDGPTALILSRQELPVLEGTAERVSEVEKGAYVLVHGDDDPDLVLIGTGSEVSVCVEAAELLEADGYTTRVVSMPSWDLFDQQGDDYQDLVLGADSPILSVEAASSFGWARWADDSVAIDHFGASAPGEQVLAEFGFTGEHVASRARALLFEADDQYLDDDQQLDEGEEDL
ncbi:MAG: transketolase-like TK C-terminal-containing protein, partial [Actinomycetes bacterium]